MKCPGQDMQYWDSDAIFEADCPECHNPVEFYKDDTTRKCPSCSHRFVNPKMDFGCAAYCKYAEQCLGTLPEEFVGSQDNLLKDKVAVEVKRYYKTDFKRISHVSKVARYAEKIGKEEGANIGIILCAAYLNDIGLPGETQETGNLEDVKQQSLAIARSILARLGSKEQVLDEVCHLIEIHNTEAAKDVLESGILSDAQNTALLEIRHKSDPIEKSILEEILEEKYVTAGGKKVAREAFEHFGVLQSH